MSRYRHGGCGGGSVAFSDRKPFPDDSGRNISIGDDTTTTVVRGRGAVFKGDKCLQPQWAHLRVGSMARHSGSPMVYRTARRPATSDAARPEFLRPEKRVYTQDLHRSERACKCRYSTSRAFQPRPRCVGRPAGPIYPAVDHRHALRGRRQERRCQKVTRLRPNPTHRFALAPEVA